MKVIEGPEIHELCQLTRKLSHELHFWLWSGFDFKGN